MNRIFYHIGDIHGCSELLANLVDFACRDAELRGGQPLFSFLGDIVDRGPQSMQAMELVSTTLERFPGSVLHLGNHDAWFLGAIDSATQDTEFEDMESWLINGGIQTIVSYSETFDLAALKRIGDKYPHHFEILRNAVLHSQCAPFLCAHAGFDPLMPFEGQPAANYHWIRDEFLEHVDPDIVPVVHGHSIVGHLPVVTENRVSIDTGACHTGRLTAFVVDASRCKVDFIQTTDAGVEFVEPELVDRGFGTVLDRLPSLFESVGDRGTLPSRAAPLLGEERAQTDEPEI